MWGQCKGKGVGAEYLGFIRQHSIEIGDDVNANFIYSDFQSVDSFAFNSLGYNVMTVNRCATFTNPVAPGQGWKHRYLRQVHICKLQQMASNM